MISSFMGMTECQREPYEVTYAARGDLLQATIALSGFEVQMSLAEQTGVYLVLQPGDVPMTES